MTLPQSATPGYTDPKSNRSRPGFFPRIRKSSVVRLASVAWLRPPATRIVGCLFYDEYERLQRRKFQNGLQICQKKSSRQSKEDTLRRARPGGEQEVHRLSPPGGVQQGLSQVELQLSRRDNPGPQRGLHLATVVADFNQQEA